MADIADMHMTMPQVFALLVAERVRVELSRLRETGGASEDVLSRAYLQIPNLVDTVEQLTSTGIEQHFADGKAVAILVTENLAQAGAFNMDGILSEEDGLYDAPPEEAATIWSAVFHLVESEDDDERRRAGFIALGAIGRPAAEAWAVAVKQTKEHEIDPPVLVSFGMRKKDEDGAELVGGLSLMIEFPARMLTACVETAKAREALASKYQSIQEMFSERPERLN